MFVGKKILVGVSGGIAAYKACELVREITRHNGSVRAMMTPDAMEFVTPLTFLTLTGHPVFHDLFSSERELGTAHIDWARWPDVIVICPATFNTIGKLAAGIADNALTTVLAATRAPVILCPAMNKEMFANVILQENIQKLTRLGYIFVAPGQGELACGEVGWGRLADIQEITDAMNKVLFKSEALVGKKILVTAGPTHEPLDPVRYLTNPSSGKMGYAVAEAAALRGAQVKLISGPCDLRAFSGVEVIRVQSAKDMADAVKKEFQAADVLIMVAAVADYRPTEVSAHKIKKSSDLILKLEPTEDILTTVSSAKGDRILIGFAVETQNELPNAQKKLQNKRLDLIVVNNPLIDGAGFAHDTNIVTLIGKNGWSESLSKTTKRQVAHRIIDWLEKQLEEMGE